MINDIVKTNIKTRLEKALHDEVLTTNSAGLKIGVNPTYLSMMKNPDTWSKCPLAAWDTVLLWINSGQKITEYAEKHGRVLPETRELKQEPVILQVVKPKKETTHDQIIATIDKSDNGKELPKQKRLSSGQMVDLLLEERELLKQKMEAIDVLLKHYIS